MREETVNSLISELEALRGVIRQMNIRVLALEGILESNPSVSQVYHHKREEIEKDPESLFPLTSLGELRKALLQDRA